jgi:hypothetical protein
MMLGGACFRVAGKVRNECHAFARLRKFSEAAAAGSNAKTIVSRLAPVRDGRDQTNGEHESAYD